MRDAIGNRITEGSVLWMEHWKCIAQVINVHEGGLSIVSGNERGVSPPVLTIKIDLPIDEEAYRNLPHGQEIQLPGILCVVNPKAEAALDRMMKQ